MWGWLPWWLSAKLFEKYFYSTPSTSFCPNMIESLLLIILSYLFKTKYAYKCNLNIYLIFWYKALRLILLKNNSSRLSYLCNYCAQLLQSCSTLCDPWNVASQAPLSMGFSWQEYWSVLPFPSPGDLPDAGIKPISLALQAKSLLLSH